MTKEVSVEGELDPRSTNIRRKLIPNTSQLQLKEIF